MEQSSSVARKNSRKFVRFTVANLKELVWKFDKFPSSQWADTFELVTMAAGGCGFYSSELERTLIPGTRLFMHFRVSEITAEFIEVQGFVKYGQKIRLGDKEVIYYGIEFVDLHQDRVTGIIEWLTHLYDQGKVRAS